MTMIADRQGRVKSLKNFVGDMTESELPLLSSMDRGSNHENGSDSPLAAGGKTLITLEQAGQIATVAADLALKAMRKERKHNRDDKGTGDELVGTMLRNSREHLGYTQAELAEKAGIHYTTIGKIESGDRGMSLQTFCKLGRWLGNTFTSGVVAYLSEQR